MTDMDVESALRRTAAAREVDKQKAAQAQFGGEKPAKEQNGFVRWMTNLPANISVGLLDSALNTMDTVEEVAGDKPEKTPNEKRMAPSDAVAPMQRLMLAGAATEGVDNGVQDPGREALIAFRDFFAQGADGRGSSTADSVTQSIAQFAIPFSGFNKAFAGVKAAQNAPKLAQFAGKVGQAAAAESSTLATAFDPHGGRLADLIQFGKHTEGKLADTLNTIAPDGAAINAYIDYMTDRGDESEAEGRFKNVIDGLAGSAAIGTLIKTGAKTLRSARAFAESPITLPEIGAPEHLAAEGQKLASEALMQFPESPHAALVHLTEQADNALDDDLARNKYLTAAEIAKNRVPDKGIIVVPTDEGHTVVAGKEPVLTFLKEEDALAAVSDARRAMGGAFEKRAAVEHAKASDANFATLHTFSRVLQTNVDRPVSTHSLLSALERNLKGDTETGAFYKELLGRLVRKKLGGSTTVMNKEGKTADTAGHFADAMNAIELYPKAFKDPQRLVHTFTHEAVHAATMHEMYSSPTVLRKMEALRKAAEKLDSEGANGSPRESSNVKRNDQTGHRQYGFTNAYEFVAEIESNPEFRKLMQKTKLEDGESAWDKYLTTIAGILGVGSLVATPAGQKEFSKLMMGPKQENDVG